MVRTYPNDGAAGRRPPSCPCSGRIHPIAAVVRACSSDGFAEGDARQYGSRPGGGRRRRQTGHLQSARSGASRFAVKPDGRTTERRRGDRLSNRARRISRRAARRSAKRRSAAFSPARPLRADATRWNHPRDPDRSIRGLQRGSHLQRHHQAEADGTEAEGRRNTLSPARRMFCRHDLSTRPAVRAQLRLPVQPGDPRLQTGGDGWRKAAEHHPSRRRRPCRRRVPVSPTGSTGRRSSIAAGIATGVGYGSNPNFG